MSEQPDGLRAADVDREFVAERLRNALNEGRLSLSEYDDRLRETYAARTYGDLKGLLTDLPEVAPAERSALIRDAPNSAIATESRSSQGRARRLWLTGVWSGWLSTSLIVTGIWFATNIGRDHFDDFWPVWVIVPWGAVLLATTIRGLATGQPGYRASRHDERRARRERRRGDRD